MLRKIISSNDSTDWSKGVVRPSMKSIWPLFLTFHLLIGIIGLIANISMFCDIIRTRLYRNNTGSYLLNLVINNILVLAVQLPMNFLILLFENWVFGEAMCYAAAIIPYLLIHSSMLTFILMSVDRYRSIAHPNKRQLNVLVCLITIWISAICAATPVVTYIHYRDLNGLTNKLANNGLCWSTGDDYSKIVFVTIFTLPALVIALILVKTASELKTKSELCKLYQTTLRSLDDKGKAIDTMHSDVDSSAGEDLNEKYKEQKWVEKEKTTQKYLTIMTCLWVACWVPMKIFTSISTNTIETADNVLMFDLALMILLPISALSSITTPLCFKLMRLKLASKFDNSYEADGRLEDHDHKSLMCASSLKIHDPFSTLDVSQFI